MIVYVDIEHLRVKEIDEKHWQRHLSLTLDVKYRLEAVSGRNCLIVHYERLTPALLQDLDAKAVLVSGNMTEFQHYEEAKLAGLRAVFRQAVQPTLAFCGGAQMLAETFGSKAAAIVPEESGDMSDGLWKERTHESGFTAVTKIADHPLLLDLTPQFMMMEAHYWEIKGLPKGFKNYAETAVTPLQLIAHNSLPLYGTQFHPESWDEAHPDGRKVAGEFFQAGIWEWG